MTTSIEADLQKSAISKQVTNSFQSSINVKHASLSVLKNQIVKAATIIFKVLMADNKLFCCGNSDSYTTCQNMAMNILKKSDTTGKTLKVISLANDTVTDKDNSGLDSSVQSFAQQIESSARKGDILLAVSTTGDENSLKDAIKTAKKKLSQVILLTGGHSEILTTELDNSDIEIKIPSDNIARIQETHILTVNCICDAIEWQLSQTKESEKI
ncbi:MAG: SIS domain-containing protein [Pseudomonadota bacterium]|nr:SIS domain-containing protein [Pseudomonadota bacterium]